MTKPTRVPPCHPCVAIFRGVRATRPGHVESIHAPVQVVEVWVGRRRELAVCMLGRATRWPIGNFSGTWSLLELSEVDDGFAEFECFWPAIDDLPDGRDVFEGVYPVSGKPS